MINEVDADTPGNDAAEFVELYDGGVGNTSLDGLVLVFFNGGTGADAVVRGVRSRRLRRPTRTATSRSATPACPARHRVQSRRTGCCRTAPTPSRSTSATPRTSPTAPHHHDEPAGRDRVRHGRCRRRSGLLPLLNAGQPIVNETRRQRRDAVEPALPERSRAASATPRRTRRARRRPAASIPAPLRHRPATATSSSASSTAAAATAARPIRTTSSSCTTAARAVDLTGWSLQYASATGSGWDESAAARRLDRRRRVLPDRARVRRRGRRRAAAGEHHRPDQHERPRTARSRSSSNFDRARRQLPDLATPASMDFVGYGSADCGEGATTAPAQQHDGALRQNGGATDTDNNGNDFAAARAQPAPHRADRRARPARAHDRSAHQRLQRAARRHHPSHHFTEPVDVDSALVRHHLRHHRHAQQRHARAARRPGSHYITPNDDFTPGEQCTVTIFKDQIHDQDLDDAAPNTDTLPANYSWTFTVATGRRRRIRRACI